MLAALLLLCAPIFLFNSFYILLFANYFYSPPVALQSNLYTVKENLTEIIVGGGAGALMGGTIGCYNYYSKRDTLMYLT